MELITQQMEWELNNVPPLEDFGRDARWYSTTSGHYCLVFSPFLWEPTGKDRFFKTAFDMYLMAPIPFARKFKFLSREFDAANIEQCLTNAKPFTHDQPIAYFGAQVTWNRFKSKHFGDEILLRFGHVIGRNNSNMQYYSQVPVFVMEGVDDGRRIYFKEARYHFF